MGLRNIEFLKEMEIQNNSNLYCQICEDFLDKHSNFPEDFPDKFKICCRCWKVANYIFFVKKQKFEMKDRVKFYIKYKKKFDELFIIKKGV